MNQAEHSQYCEQLAQAGNPLFRLSRVYASQPDRALVSLHALFACIQQIGMSFSDDEVAQRKLLWWFEESRAENRGSSLHPVWCELNRAGADKWIPQAGVDRLLESAQRRQERPAFNDMEDLERGCHETARPLCELELALSDCESETGNIPRPLLVRRGLWLLMSETFLAGGNGSPWWVPLSLLARAGLTRGELEEAPDSDSARKLFADLTCSESVSLNEKTDISAAPQGATHLFVLDSLIGDSLRRLRRAKSLEMGKLGFSSTLTAWSAARRFNRRK